MGRSVYYRILKVFLEALIVFSDLFSPGGLNTTLRLDQNSQLLTWKFEAEYIFHMQSEVNQLQ